MEMRQQKQRPRRLWVAPVFALGFAVAGAAAAVLVLHRPPAASQAAAVAVTATEPTPPPTAAAPLASLVTFLQGEVRHNTAPASARTVLRAGDVIETGAGRVAVQFGPDSGVVLEPRTRVDIVSWEDRAIVLRVAGAAGFELAPRAAGQRFAVVAGERTVEVRGTVFRVAERAGDLDVAVHRGRVEVTEGSQRLAVDAGARLAMARGETFAARVPEVLSEPARQALAEGARVHLLPAWLPGQAPPMLAVTAPARTRVRIDGVEVGRGSFQIRAASGRHLVEAAGTARWVDVEGLPGDDDEAPAVVISAPRSERPAQVDAQLVVHRAAVSQCAAAERKAAPGFAGEIEVEIGIASDGSVSYVAPFRSAPRASRPSPSPSPSIERCLLGLVRDRFTFPRGTEATVRKAIAF
jgi:hypothetical protein